MARKIKKAATMIKELERKFGNNIHAIDREGMPGQFIISAEDGDMIEGWPVGDYYDAAYYDPEEKHHRFGINKVLLDFCKERGWYLGWDTPGSILAWIEK